MRSGCASRWLRSGGTPLTWSPQAREQFAVVEKVAADGNFDDAPRATTILRNVLAPVPAFSESSPRYERQPSSSRNHSIASSCWPLRRRRHRPRTHRSALRDGDLSPVVRTSPPWGAFPLTTDGEAGHHRRESRGAPVRRWCTHVVTGARSAIGHLGPRETNIAALDWNHDFRTDLVMAAGGVRLLLQSRGRHVPAPRRGTGPGADDCGPGRPTSRWMATSISSLAPRKGRLSSCETTATARGSAQQPFAGVCCASVTSPGRDLDRDADPDAVFVDASGALHLFANRQAGAFARSQGLAGPRRRRRRPLATSMPMARSTS